MSENNPNSEKEREKLANESIGENGFPDENTSVSEKSKRLVWLMTLGVIGFALLLGFIWIATKQFGGSTGTTEATSEENKKVEETNTPTLVKLEPEMLSSAKLEFEGVTQRPAVSLLKVTGSVESNQLGSQQATPLVAGRVEQVFVTIGDQVKAGSPLAVISSPQIAELRGKMHEATTQLQISERNYARVQRSENRVSVLQAKAKLDESEAALARTKNVMEENINSAKAKLIEAEATLKRTKRLNELGAGAGKDLIAAEANYKVEKSNLERALSSKDVVSAEAAYKTAQAEFNFQNNISLSREIQEAQALVETNRVDVNHMRDQLKALGASVSESNVPDQHSRNTSLLTLYSPVAGTVTERLVNPGAGIEAAKPIFTISNISAVWIVANVPEVQVGLIRPGTRAEISSATLGSEKIIGEVSYVDPQLNEETRTARVRIVLPNPGERLKVGMFTNVGFQASTGAATGEELVVAASAIQRLGSKIIVFLEKPNEAGVFEVREVETGGDSEGYTKILSGLKIGEKVVTNGSFILKTQLEKSLMGEEE